MTLAHPTSVASTRSLRYGALAVLANALLAAGSLAVLLTVVDPGAMPTTAVALDALKFVVVALIAVAAIRAGITGLRETADGTLRRRGWAIAGIAVAGTFSLLTAVSLMATTALSLWK